MQFDDYTTRLRNIATAAETAFRVAANSDELELERLTYLHGSHGQVRQMQQELQHIHKSQVAAAGHRFLAFKQRVEAEFNAAKIRLNLKTQADRDLENDAEAAGHNLKVVDVGQNDEAEVSPLMGPDSFLNRVCDALGLPNNVQAIRIDASCREAPTLTVRYAHFDRMETFEVASALRSFDIMPRVEATQVQSQ